MIRALLKVSLNCIRKHGLVLLLFILFVQFLESKISYGSSDQENTIKMAEELQKAGKVSVARDLLAVYLKKSPNNPVVWTKLADILLIEGETKKAYTIAKRIHEDVPDYEWPLIIMYKALLDQKNLKLAEKTLNKLKELNAKVNLHLLEGDLMRFRGDLNAADTFYAKAAEEQKGDLEISKLRIWNLKQAVSLNIEKKEINLALEQVKNLLLLVDKEERSEIEILMAKVYRAQGKWIAVHKVLERALKRSSQNEIIIDSIFEARMALASHFYTKKQMKLAKDWLNQAETIRVGVDTYLLRAKFSTDAGRFEDAERFYKLALTIKPGDSYIYEAMSWNYVLWDKLKESDDALEKSIKLAPDNPRFLVIQANRDNGRRKLTKALYELGQAKDICVKNKNCEKFDEIYNPDFFMGTSVEGFALDWLKTPIAVSGTFARYNRTSDLMSLSRGLSMQEIDLDKKELVLAPKSNPYFAMTASTRAYFPKSPIVNFTLSKEEKLTDKNGEDPSIPTKSLMIGLELDWAFDFGSSSQIAVFPYIKNCVLNGHKVDNINVTGPEIKSNEFIYGLRGLLNIMSNVPRFEMELSQGTLEEGANYKSNTLRSFASAFQQFDEWAYARLGVSTYDKFSSGSKVQNLLSNFGQFTLLPNWFFTLQANYETSTSRDKIINEEATNQGLTGTRQRSESYTFELKPIKYTTLKYKKTLTYIEKYSFYNNAQEDFEMGIFIPLVMTRSFAESEHLYKYSTPINWTFGFTHQKFPKLPVGDPNYPRMTEDKFKSYFTTLKLFW